MQMDTIVFGPLTFSTTARMARRVSACFLLGVYSAAVAAAQDVRLPGTEPLTEQGDLASKMVEGIDRFLTGATSKSIERRARHWSRETSSPDAYFQSIAENRRQFARIIGVRDKRVGESIPEALNWVVPARLGESAALEVFLIDIPVFGTIRAEGLLLEPKASPPVASVVALPDADQTVEQICGLRDGLPPGQQFARRLAECGCRVVALQLVSREVKPRNGRARMTNREYLYRPAFELGRHIIGYEVQKVRAAIDWLFHSSKADDKQPIGVIGWGEGGLIALYSAAVDQRIDAACVSGYFDSRQDVWREPLDRNVFGLLNQFGDAEIAGLITPRKLTVEAARGPELVLPPGMGGAPGRLMTPKLINVRAEVARVKDLTAGLTEPPSIELIETDDGAGPPLDDRTLARFLASLAASAKLEPRAADPPSGLVDGLNANHRQARLVEQIDRHNQWLLTESPYVRREFMTRLDPSSLDKFTASAEWYRRYFYDEVIGRIENPLLPPKPRSRRVFDNENWTGYEIVLDVFPNVFAFGILLVPRDIQPGERRPCVVCQHGLEGRPRQTIEGDHRAYHDFATKLCERGFVVFAPQNPYIFGDRFRTLQRKANPLKKSLFSIIVPQHQQITNWLSGLDFVDADRIGFYGLSYGGKTAMRVPPLVDRYCLSICSADFNDWIWKNASTRAPYSYVWTGEYEIFEFDLGSTFNYAEMAALVAPRPFMVERGHFDGVASDEAVAYEFAKVRHLYQAKLGIGDRCDIEWFVGPHTIHGQGTFDFLHKHLKWPVP